MRYSILALTRQRANCPDDPLRPAARGRQVGVLSGSAARGLLARPGREGLDVDRSRRRREARFGTRPGHAGLIRIEPPGRTRRPIHGDGEALDSLTRSFEANGFDVIPAPSVFRAQAHLEGDRGVEVVIAPWDDTHPIGGEMYHWVLQNRPDLRNRFVFLAADVAPEFDAVVGGRCLAVPITAMQEVVRVAAGIAKRVRTPRTNVPKRPPRRNRRRDRTPSWSASSIVRRSDPSPASSSSRRRRASTCGVCRLPSAASTTT